MTVCLYVFPPLLQGVPAAPPGRRHQGHHRRHAAAAAQAAVGRADLGLLTLPIDDPALATVPVMREELLLVAAGRARPRERPAVAGDGAGRPAVHPVRSRLEHAPRASTSSSSARRSSRASSPRPRTSRSSSRWSPPASASASSRSSRSRGRSAAASLTVARIEGQQLVRETGWVHLRAERVPRMVQRDDGHAARESCRACGSRRPGGHRRTALERARSRSPPTTICDSCVSPNAKSTSC